MGGGGGGVVVAGGAVIGAGAGAGSAGLVAVGVGMAGDDEAIRTEVGRGAVVDVDGWRGVVDDPRAENLALVDAPSPRGPVVGARVGFGSPIAPGHGEAAANAVSVDACSCGAEVTLGSSSGFRPTAHTAPAVTHTAMTTAPTRARRFLGADSGRHRSDPGPDGRVRSRSCSSMVTTRSAQASAE